MFLGVIPPDTLPLVGQRGLAAERGDHLRCRRAPIDAVEPAVGAKEQAVGHRVRVFQAEAREVHNRIGIRHSIAVGICVAEQIGRVHHPDAALAHGNARGDVEAVNRHLVRIEAAIAVGVGEHTHSVTARHMVGRRSRHPVKHRAQVLVVPHHLEPGRKGILPVFDHPHPALLVETDLQRLRNQGLAGNQVYRQVIGQCQHRQGFFWRSRLAAISKIAPPSKLPHDPGDLGIAGLGRRILAVRLP